MHISGVELQVIRIKKPTGILNAIGRDWGGLAHLTLGSRGQHCKCMLWVARQWSPSNMMCGQTLRLRYQLWSPQCQLIITKNAYPLMELQAIRIKKPWTIEQIVYWTLGNRGHHIANVRFGLHVSEIEGHMNIRQTLRLRN